MAPFSCQPDTVQQPLMSVDVMPIQFWLSTFINASLLFIQLCMDYGVGLTQHLIGY